IVAMGVADYHAVAGGTYGSGDGTSFATPIAAGIAALLKSAWPHLTNAQIRKIFLESGDNTSNPNYDRGWGLISAKKAISYPNLSAVNDVYKVINKIFIDENGVNSSTVKLNYSIGGSSFQSVTMNQVAFNNTIKYNYTLPTSTNGDSVKFYFTYQTDSGGLVQEPATGTYKFSYGSFNISNLTSVKINDEIPTNFNLAQNYPNPFNPSTVISYQLSAPSKVTLKVYDLLGREVAVLVNEVQQPGNYNSQFSIVNYQLSSGVYFYRLQTDNFSATKKMMLIK
ncbi:MAG: T9SS type A sorting domain-containing protein, partial [Melioribacteraceae bacterium]